MSEAVERLVNLALFLASARGAVTAADIREKVAGYPTEADDVAFKRMLERDKDTLRSSGLAIEADDVGNYRFDRAASYVAPLDLSADEAAALRAAGLAVLDDPSFPFSADLRLALTKITAEVEASDLPIATALADEEPARQGRLVADLSSAAARCKRIAFGYTNSLGASGPHEAEPYGVFLHDGRWYLVARDTARDEVRTYAVGRMADLEVSAAAPKTPDFERPDDFDVAAFIRLPFQYGPASAAFTARLRFDANSAWRAKRLAGRHGVLAPDGDEVVWEVEARSAGRLAQYAIENGPGILVEGPEHVVRLLAEGLDRAEAAHA